MIMSQLQSSERKYSRASINEVLTAGCQFRTSMLMKMQTGIASAHCLINLPLAFKISRGRLLQRAGTPRRARASAYAAAHDGLAGPDKRPYSAMLYRISDRLCSSQPRQVFLTL